VSRTELGRLARPYAPDRLVRRHMARGMQQVITLPALRGWLVRRKVDGMMMKTDVAWARCRSARC